MTSERARAYARVIKTLHDLGPAKLRSPEQALTRLAAFSAFDDMCDRLVATGRWTPQRADEFADNVWACGPALEMTLRAA